MEHICKINEIHATAEKCKKTKETKRAFQKHLKPTNTPLY
jgi:hypothetical protein